MSNKKKLSSEDQRLFNKAHAMACDWVLYNHPHDAEDTGIMITKMRFTFLEDLKTQGLNKFFSSGKPERHFTTRKKRPRVPTLKQTMNEASSHSHEDKKISKFVTSTDPDIVRTVRSIKRKYK